LNKRTIVIIILLLIPAFPLSVGAIDKQIEKWVVIIGGYAKGLESKWDAGYCYAVMSENFSVPDDHIYYLYCPQELAAYSQPDGETSKTQVHYAISDWLANRSSEDDMVFIFYSGHGLGFNGTFDQAGEPVLEGGRIDGSSDERTEHEYSNGTWFGVDENLNLKYDQADYYWDDEFKADLSLVHYGIAVIMFDACYSGGFIDDLSGPNRIIITAVNETSYSYWDLNGDMMSEFCGPFFDALRGQHCNASRECLWPDYPVNDSDTDGNGKVSILEAYDYAVNHDYSRWSVRTQNGTIPDLEHGKDASPWLDDNGDGLPTFVNGSDHFGAGEGQLAGETYFDMEMVNLAVVGIQLVGTLDHPLEVYHGDMRWNDSHVTLNYNVTISRLDDYSPPDLVNASVTLKRTNADNTSDWHLLDEVVVPLEPSSTTFRVLTWDENETLTSGNWSISASIKVPAKQGLYDENGTNNELSWGTIAAEKLVGDVNGDGIVELMDFRLACDAYGSTPSDPNWNPDCDLYPQPDGDGMVEMMDFFVLSEHYGQTMGGTYVHGTEGGGGMRVFTSGDPALQVDPAQIIVFKNETFTVNVKVTDVTDLYGWEFKLYWNSTVLNCTSVEISVPGIWTDMTEQLGTGLENSFNATHGRYWRALAPKCSAPSFNGTMSIVTFTFRAKEAGTTGLLLRDDELCSSSGTLIAHTRSHGSVDVYVGRYMRSDTRTVNGLNAYVLNSTESASQASFSQSASEYQTVYWGVRAWVRHSNGVEAEVSMDGQTGTPKAIISRDSGSGIQSNTVAVSETSLQSTDSLIVRVYMKIGSGNWNLAATFSTEQLQATRLQSVTWTVYYYTSYSYSIRLDRTTGKYHWGTPTYNSRVQNLQYY
jgi:hypothetical protein